MLNVIRELWAYRVLIQTLVLRELKARYRGSTLGLLWTLLNPLLHMTIYALVFSVYMRIDMEHYAVFLLTGLLPWIWLSSSLTAGATSIVVEGQLLKKVFFPPQVLPAVSVIVNLLNFALGLPLLIVFLISAGLRPGLAVLALPLLVACQFAFTLGVCLVVATASVRYRDVPQILGHLLTFWFFLTPIIYPIEVVPEAFRPVLAVNPMTSFMSAYQLVLMEGALPTPATMVTIVVLSGAGLWLGSLAFERFRWVCVEEI